MDKKKRGGAKEKTSKGVRQPENFARILKANAGRGEKS